jgi:hypothetical protein
MNVRHLAAAAALVIGSSVSAGASTISVDWVLVNTTGGSGTIATDTLTVGPGVEIDCPTAPIGGTSTLCAQFGVASSIDIRPDSIRYDGGPATTGYAPGDFNGWIFSNLSTLIPGGVASLVLSTNIPGLDLSRLSFTPDTLSVNMQGLGGVQIQQFAEITFLSTPVPEPATSLLTGVGLLGAWFSRRRRTASRRQAV